MVPVRLLGYTRVSTSSQDAQLQLDALVSAGVQNRDVFPDASSWSRTTIERPVAARRASADTLGEGKWARIGHKLRSLFGTTRRFPLWGGGLVMVGLTGLE